MTWPKSKDDFDNIEFIELRLCDYFFPFSIRDPIIRSSTVDGLCMKAEHCSNLPSTQCKTVEGTEYMTCQCIDGSTKGMDG